MIPGPMERLPDRPGARWARDADRLPSSSWRPHWGT